jgi:hypothetical protein
MKQKLILYLFVFSILIILFQFVNSKNIVRSYESELSKNIKLNQKLKDSIDVLATQIDELQYFNLDQNDDALAYFESEGYDINTLIPKIKDEFIALNEKALTDKPFVPHQVSKDRPMVLNHFKVLNHKWIIADFSDVEFWGEVLVRYNVTKDASIDFEILDSFIYPVN